MVPGAARSSAAATSAALSGESPAWFSILVQYTGSVYWFSIPPPLHFPVTHLRSRFNENYYTDDNYYTHDNYYTNDLMKITSRMIPLSAAATSAALFVGSPSVAFQ